MLFENMAKLVVGKTIERIVEAEAGSDYMIIAFTDGCSIRFEHVPDCCEEVLIEDVCGNPDDFSGQVLTLLEERDNGDIPNVESRNESETWTFYELQCPKGSLTIRWYGGSNGYYSEEATVTYFDEIGERHYVESCD